MKLVSFLCLILNSFINVYTFSLGIIVLQFENNQLLKINNEFRNLYTNNTVKQALLQNVYLLGWQMYKNGEEPTN